MKNNLTITLLTIALLANVTISFSQQNTSDGLNPISLNDGIKIGTCSKVGIDTAVINEITTQITSGFYPNIHSLLIYKNNRLVYEKYFPGKYSLEIIDVYQQKMVAQKEQLVALPLLVKLFPLPERKLIGDLSDTEKVLKGLGINE